MPNNRFNKKVTPKGYKMGGRTGKMGGGMMMKRPMMKKGGVASEAKKKQFKTNQAKQKETTKKVLKKVGKAALMLNPITAAPAAGMNVAKKIKERMGKKMGGALKPVDPKTQKGLSKLPTEVRNKMGYMKKGGKVHGK